MGLDIYAYRNADKLPNYYVDEQGYACDKDTHERNHAAQRIWVNPDFPDRADELEDGAFYDAESAESSVTMGYGNYGNFRNTLAAVAGWPAQEGERFPYSASVWYANGGPFWELINFSDCEGVIGPNTCAKIAADFAAYQEKADAHPDELFRNRYAQVRQLFEHAAGSGFVKFR